MTVFETTAVLDDARHLTLGEPPPQIPGQRCRVILFFDAENAGEPPPGTAAAWPPGFFEGIRVDDPAFARPAQGEAPPIPSLGGS